MTRALLGNLAILPRRRTGALLLALLAAASMLFAQYRSKRPPAHALRAVGVLEWPAGGKGTPRLVPLIILADGTYYDASIYRASPVPMAVEPGTVYEGQEAGVAKGLFTISAAQELAEQKLWYGAGTWAEGETGSSAIAAGEEDRPMLRHSKREESSAPAPGQAQPAPQAPTEQEVESDPNRPQLHHGKPAIQATAPVAPAPPAKPVAAPSVATPAATPPPRPAPPKRMAAVSDAQPGESRSFVLSWSPSEKEALKKKAVALAEAEIAKYTIAPAGQRAVPGPLSGVQVRFFDVFSDNAPQVVLSAHLPAGSYRPPAARASRRSKAKPAAAQVQPDIYITLVARSDLDGNLRKIFVSITDPGRLDAVPRLELIDAVDADGRGMGQLLFHKIGPRDAGLEGNVVLYRVDPDRLTELFDSWVQ